MNPGAPGAKWGRDNARSPAVLAFKFPIFIFVAAATNPQFPPFLFEAADGNS